MDFDLGEGFVVVLLAIALLGVAWAAISIVWIAPDFMAELVVDAALSTGLYRRLRSIDGDHWLRTAIRKTFWRFLGVLLPFALAGAAMQHYVPGTHSAGQLIRHWVDAK